ncbi:ATP-binding protein [Sphaerisporangium siamense]|uniref:Anti-sigma regulatory factor (Ser/Thr protein kinase) n=1 Tax=Sphaerisporangium siamense TaxID=795645 RepID=A0A7W7GAA2_9ACTN|nr:ATP-binding protein [Sphaerisporangium siamense]MBB4703733.1 anti-sigma regulatory factor (Ser/Thr protein kinase) [Sphaerisporangium siamense]
MSPRRWDLFQQAEARHLDQMEPAWCVWYGLGTRHFYAVATWTTPEPLLVEARTAGRLRDLMREAEGPAFFTPPRGLSAAFASSRRPSPPGATMTSTQDGERAVRWELPHDLALIGRTRGMAREVLGHWELSVPVDDVVLVVGELLANAIRHGEAPVTLVLRAVAGRLHVEVTDHGPAMPRYLDLGVEAVHGRGLGIVGALADESGVDGFSDFPGKMVWARWRLLRGSGPG